MREKRQNSAIRQCQRICSGKMKGLCDARGIRIILTVFYSPSSNGATTEGTRTMLDDSGLSPRFWVEAMTTFMQLRNRTPSAANNGKTPYELFYNMKPDVSYIRPFGCATKVALPTEELGRLDLRAAMGYPARIQVRRRLPCLGPKMGVKEARDVVFYGGHAPVR